MIDARSRHGRVYPAQGRGDESAIPSAGMMGRGTNASFDVQRLGAAGLPAASSAIFSTRASACRNSSSQRRLSASPRS
jgi:hypothetical protein